MDQVLSYNRLREIVALHGFVNVIRMLSALATDSIACTAEESHRVALLEIRLALVTAANQIAGEKA